jgi:hypothetical protein
VGEVVSDEWRVASELQTVENKERECEKKREKRRREQAREASEEKPRGGKLLRTRNMQEEAQQSGAQSAQSVSGCGGVEAPTAIDNT